MGAKRKRVDHSQEETEALRQLEETLCKKLGVEKLSVKNLRSALLERNIPKTGTKLEMAKRLDFFFNKQEANPTTPPIATDYIREDQDLSESDGDEEGNEDDPKDAEGAGDADSLVGLGPSTSRQRRSPALLSEPLC